MMHRPGFSGPIFRVVVKGMRVMRMRDLRIAMCRMMIGVPVFRVVVRKDLKNIQYDQDAREAQPTGLGSFPSQRQHDTEDSVGSGAGQGPYWASSGKGSIRTAMPAIIRNSGGRRVGPGRFNHSSSTFLQNWRGHHGTGKDSRGIETEMSIKIYEAITVELVRHQCNRCWNHRLQAVSMFPARTFSSGNKIFFLR